MPLLKSIAWTGNAVLHFQSLNATSLACLPLANMDFNVVPEVPYHIGSVAVLQYMEPGSPELADAVVAALENHNLVLLQNHGQVTIGRNFREALLRAVYFKFACAVILKGGGNVQKLSREASEKLRRRSLQEKSGGV